MTRIRQIGLWVLVPLLLLPGSVAAGTAAGDSVVGSGWRLFEGTPNVWFELDARSDASGGDARGTYTFHFPDLGVSFYARFYSLSDSAALLWARVFPVRGIVLTLAVSAVLVRNYLRLPDQGQRRRIRLVVSGALLLSQAG